MVDVNTNTGDTTTQGQGVPEKPQTLDDVEQKKEEKEGHEDKAGAEPIVKTPDATEVVPQPPAPEIDQAREGIARTIINDAQATQDDSNQVTDDSAADQTQSVTTNIPLPEPEVDHDEPRELAVTPTEEFAKTINTLEKEEAFEEEEDAVRRARDLEQGQTLDDVVKQD